MTADGHTLDFTYDASGRPVSVTYGGIPYFYVLNLQGDIVAILDSSGTAVVQYTYSAWGRYLTCTGELATSLGYYNPLRYRGYVYDQELGLYYLQSRYYNPGLCHFNAPDAFASTGQGILGNNMFAYCRNNPVSRIDISGNADTSIEEEFDDDVEVTPAIPEVAGGGQGIAGGTNSNGAGGGSPRSHDNRQKINEQRAIDEQTGSTGKAYTFRQKLQIYTGQDGKGKHAHHIFPQKFRVKFKAIGIDIDSAENGAWWDASDHLKNAWNYNKAWEMYFGLESTSKSTAMIFGDLLKEIYGLNK